MTPAVTRLASPRRREPVRSRTSNTSGSPILICYDGSPDAVRAVVVAGTLFPGRSAIMLYAWPGIDPRRVHTTSVEGVRQELIEEVRVGARREAIAVAKEGTTLAEDAGLKARPLTVEAPDGVANAIVRVAKSESACAVVVGHRTRTRVGSRLHRSVTRRMVDHSPTAVVVV